MNTFLLVLRYILRPVCMDTGSHWRVVREELTYRNCFQWVYIYLHAGACSIVVKCIVRRGVCVCSLRQVVSWVAVFHIHACLNFFILYQTIYPHYNRMVSTVPGILSLHINVSSMCIDAKITFQSHPLRKLHKCHIGHESYVHAHAQGNCEQIM